MIAKNGDILIADGESTNTRVVHRHRCAGTAPGRRSPQQARPGVRSARPVHHAVDESRHAVGRLREGRSALRRRRHREQLPVHRQPQGRRVIERIDGLENPTAVTVDEQGAIYIAEVNGANVRKLVKAR